jgi:hypothetical protein
MTMIEIIRNWDPTEGDLCQGDVLLFRLPKDLTPAQTEIVQPRDGKLILAEGELTGHHHAIWLNPPMFRDDGLARAIEAQSQPAVRSDPAALYRDNGLVRRLVDDGLLTDGSLCIGFLVVEDAPVLLRHQEHDTVRVPPGHYYVGRQREFHAGEKRRVAD